MPLLQMIKAAGGMNRSQNDYLEALPKAMLPSYVCAVHLLYNQDWDCFLQTFFILFIDHLQREATQLLQMIQGTHFGCYCALRSCVHFFFSVDIEKDHLNRLQILEAFPKARAIAHLCDNQQYSHLT